MNPRRYRRAPRAAGPAQPRMPSSPWGPPETVSWSADRARREGQAPIVRRLAVDHQPPFEAAPGWQDQRADVDRERHVDGRPGPNSHGPPDLEGALDRHRLLSLLRGLRDDWLPVAVDALEPELVLDVRAVPRNLDVSGDRRRARLRPGDRPATAKDVQLPLDGPSGVREHHRDLHPAILARDSEPATPPIISLPFRARSSVGERSLHTREVAGSKPAAPMASASDPNIDVSGHPA